MMVGMLSEGVTMGVAKMSRSALKVINGMRYDREADLFLSTHDVHQTTQIVS
jgi:hypothetical protein